jgi:hypothetical protein
MLTYGIAATAVVAVLALYEVLAPNPRRPVRARDGRAGEPL